MDTRKVPLLLSLTATLAAAIVSFLGHLELKDYLIRVLLVLIGSYILGCIIKLIFDKAGMKKEDVDERIAEEKKKEEQEQAAAQDEAVLENEDGSVREKDKDQT
ncbi:MAG: hypothetical protein J5842_08365 [Lachnospiraceae bacterium]|nr:hypothetical protein [Lachnospiraceae bacterium]